MTVAVNTAIDPRVAKEIAEQIELAQNAITELRESIATARSSQLPGLIANFQRELAYKSELRRIENLLSFEATVATKPAKLILLAQLRQLAEESRHVANNGRNESREIIESRGLALRAITNAVYYALYDDLRDNG